MGTKLARNRLFLKTERRGEREEGREKGLRLHGLRGFLWPHSLGNGKGLLEPWVSLTKLATAGDWGCRVRLNAESLSYLSGHEGISGLPLCVSLLYPAA